MNRFLYVNNYKRPSSVFYLGRAWCHWNENQVRSAGGWNDAQFKMVDVAKKYGYHTYGANHFVEIVRIRHDNGVAEVEFECYYKT